MDLRKLEFDFISLSPYHARRNVGRPNNESRLLNNHLFTVLNAINILELSAQELHVWTADCDSLICTCKLESPSPKLIRLRPSPLLARDWLEIRTSIVRNKFFHGSLTFSAFAAWLTDRLREWTPVLAPLMTGWPMKWTRFHATVPRQFLQRSQESAEQAEQASSISNKRMTNPKFRNSADKPRARCRNSRSTNWKGGKRNWTHFYKRNEPILQGQTMDVKRIDEIRMKCEQDQSETVTLLEVVAVSATLHSLCSEISTFTDNLKTFCCDFSPSHWIPQVSRISALSLNSGLLLHPTTADKSRLRRKQRFRIP